MDADAFKLEVEAHDATRVEWSVYLPLPAGKHAVDAEVSVAVEVPESAYSPHSGWDQLQILARLSSPAEEAVDSGGRSIDELRRASLSVAKRMKALREQLERCAASPPSTSGLSRFLEPLVEGGLTLLAQARKKLTASEAKEPPEVVRERNLADEFLGGQLLELLTVAEEACAAAVRIQPEGAALGEREALERLHRRIEAALTEEFEHRALRGDILPVGEDPEVLASFLERAALLKKHFHEVLYLDHESSMVDQHLRNVVGVGGAAAAFVGWFALNLLQTNAAARAGLGLGTVLTLGALAYAAKDRLKELTKSWLAGKLTHLYANRLSTLKAPSRLCPGQPIVLQARETLQQARMSRPDPLNPGGGALQRIVELRYRQRARLRRAEGLSLTAFDRLKLIFRYDLSPLLARLDDSVKRVPVAALSGGRIRFADAPRLYRVPVTITVRCAGEAQTLSATLLLQRNGIERIVRGATSVSAVPAPRTAQVRRPASDGLAASEALPVHEPSTVRDPLPIHDELPAEVEEATPPLSLA